MAINLGALAGGLAQGGMSTYKALNDIEAQKKETELREAQLQAIKDERTSKEALRTAIATSGDIGTATPATEYAGPAPAGAPQQGGYTAPAYSAAQKTADFQRSAIAAGADPVAVQSYMSGHYGLKNAQREAEFNDQFDTLKADWDKRAATHKQEVDAILAKDGAQGVIKKFGGEFSDSTGNTLKAVGNDIIVSGKDGKQIEKFPVEQFPAKLEGALGHRYVTGFAEELAKKGMFKNADSAIAFMQKQQELGVHAKTAEAAMIGAKAKADTVASENAKNYGMGNYYNGFGRQASGGGGADAGKALRAQKLVESGEAKDITAAYRIIQGKDAREAVDRDWAATRLELTKAGTTPAGIAQHKEAFYAENGVAPQAFAQAIATGIDPSTGKPFDPKKSAEIISDFNRKYPISRVDPESLSWFKPAGTTTEKTEANKTVTAPAKKEAAVVVNPYVDKTGRAIPRAQAPEGAPAPITALPGAVKDVVTSTGDVARSAYLRGKIERRETLSPGEMTRARALGLLPD